MAEELSGDAVKTRNGVGAGLTIVSTLAPTLGFPLPMSVRWALFSVGVLLLVWPLIRWVAKRAVKMVGQNLIPLMLGVMGTAGVVLIAGAAIGAVVYFRQSAAAGASDGSKAKIASTQEQFLKEPVLTPWTDAKHPLMFLGTPTLTTDRLRVVVEYSLYRSGWMSPVRFELDPVKEPIKGKRFTLPVASMGTKQNGGLEDMWWGTAPQSDNLVTNNPVYENNVAASLTRGRIVIVGPDNKEQNALYFEIVRGINDQSGNIRFMVLQGREVADWISDWEKDS